MLVLSSLLQAWSDSIKNSYIHRLLTDPHAVKERRLKYKYDKYDTNDQDHQDHQDHQENPYLLLYRHLETIPEESMKMASLALDTLVQDLHALGIPVSKYHPPPFNIVLLQTCHRFPNLEMGASFTMGTTMFLRYIQPSIVRHEGVHIFQRLYPNLFEAYYARQYPGLQIVPHHQVQRFFLQHPSLIDNPDCSITDTTQYAFPTPQGPIMVFYDQTMSTVAVNVSTGSLTTDTRGYHHPHELIASKMET